MLQMSARRHRIGSQKNENRTMRKIGHTKSRVESRQAWSLFVVCLLLSLMGLHGSAYGQASQEVIKANLILTCSESVEWKN